MNRLEELDIKRVGESHVSLLRLDCGDGYSVRVWDAIERLDGRYWFPDEDKARERFDRAVADLEKGAQ